MIHRSNLTLTLLLLILGASYAEAEPDMQEGLWEITAKMEMEGLPVTMPPMTYTQCMTKESMVPQKIEKENNCKITENKMQGDTLIWAMECEDQDTRVSSSGKIIYKGDTFEGSIKVTSRDPDSGEMLMTQQISGRRIGDCNQQQ